MSVVTQIQIRRGTAAEWTSANPTLASGEWGFETDTKKGKIGDGTTAWNSLAYVLGVGDIDGVTAGTGLTGGGTSGTVTLSIDSTVTTLTGSQTLTNKTLTSPTINTPTLTLSGTSSSTQAVIAWDQTNKQLDIGDGSTIRTITADNAAATLQNKTISGASNTLSSIGNSSLTNSSITINGTAVSLGGSVTIEASSFVPSFMLGGM